MTEKKIKLLFIDRDGTLIEEPADEQIDSFEKLKFVKGVFKNLGFISQHLDFKLIMVSNQDGLGTDSFPEKTFWPVHNFILQTLEGEGITFDKQHIDRHFPEDNAPTRKPGTGMLTEYIDNYPYAQYMALPRLSAIAEVGWSYDRKDYASFMQRMRHLTQLFDYYGYNYCKHEFADGGDGNGENKQAD